MNNYFIIIFAINLFLNIIFCNQIYRQLSDEKIVISVENKLKNDEKINLIIDNKIRKKRYIDITEDLYEPNEFEYKLPAQPIRNYESPEVIPESDGKESEESGQQEIVINTENPSVPTDLEDVTESIAESTESITESMEESIAETTESIEESTESTESIVESTEQSTSDAPSSGVCSDENTAGGCVGPKDCLYPNQDDCSSYIKCEKVEGEGWKPTVKPCTEGLQWNDNKKECYWPSSSTCQLTTQQSSEESTEQTTSAETTTERPEETTTEASNEVTTEEEEDSTTQQPEQTSTSPPTTTEGAEETTTEEEAEQTTTQSTTTSQSESKICNQCCDETPTDDNLDLVSLCSGCPQKRLVPNPNSNQRYIECNGGANGTTNSVKKCSLGLLFSSNSLTCDYAGLVDPNGPSR